ncbi:ATP-binding cassette domain-containing protein [Leucobacter massiliensis]|uniref:ABC transporter domain-containing protein n=1 Tax=Leucobacter massiliensis TaxID=1686285 RepID=A0A2S9QLD4_9MICO|nr:ATP-binding cassette domain-containing protein [Leucobacter massiliensis]PRI10405.1 hypothetical protein B4915_12190 [Leucobacter massiliensis]
MSISAPGHAAAAETPAPLPIRHSPGGAATITPTDASEVLALRDATIRGPRGTVFGPLTSVSRRPVTAVLGPRGSGRTSLLLAATGRMRLSAGRVTVLGEDRPAAIRRRSGIAGFAQIDALDPDVSVGAALRERLAWALPWYRRTPRMSDALTSELLAQAFGEYAHPQRRTLVGELSPAEELLLRVALALVEDPSLLAVDDLDALREPGERAILAERLRALADDGIRVLTATSDPGDLSLLDGGGGPGLIEL